MQSSLAVWESEMAGNPDKVPTYKQVAVMASSKSDKGYAEGRAEAYEDANKQLDAYFKQIDAVREKGEDFNEPPPKFGNNRR